MTSDFQRLQDALPRRYTVQRELDRGGMSRVYLAREEHPHRDVVIKVLDEELTARVGRERFILEVEVTSKLAHPHIVPLYAAGDAEGTLYYVMPFVQGESLRERLDREDQLEVTEALSVTRDVARALSYAHSQGVVHRDIKPANILFQHGHAVVADFGIARALSGMEGDTITQAGLAIGTPDYMSPEQASGQGMVDGRTDQYALACVLFEMLGGQAPFHSKSAQATLARHMTDQPPSLRALRPAVSPVLEDVIRRALAKTPADRYETVDDFVAALELAQKPAATPAAAASPSDSLWDRPLGWSLRVAGLALAVAAVGVAWSVWSPDDPGEAFAETRYVDSVAVMPLENQTGDPAMDYLGASLAEEISGQLAQVPEVKVTSPFSAMALAGANLTIPRLADTLNVGQILRGSFGYRNGDLVVRVSHVDAGDVVRGTESYASGSADLIGAQSEIALGVSTTFLDRIGVSGEIATPPETVGPGREAHLLGSHWLGRRTAEGMRRATEQFTAALALEPENAESHASLSSTYALSLYYKYDLGIPPYQMAARALEHAQRAIELDPTLANGYASLGYARVLLNVDGDAAVEDFARARELAPNAPNGPSWSARILAQRGMVEAAFREVQRARDLDPLQSGRRTAVASLALQMGELDLVIEESRAALDLEPTLFLARAYEARALALAGRSPECTRLGEFGPHDGVWAICLFAAGRGEEARTVADSVVAAWESRGEGDGGYLWALRAEDLASYHAFRGDAEASLMWIRRAFDETPTGLEVRIYDSGLFDPVRDAPGFQDAVDKMRRDAVDRVLAAVRAAPTLIYQGR